MSDNLEKFINRNRGDFDTEMPADGTWKKIEAALPVKKEARKFSIRELYKWTAAAAFVCILLTSVYFIYIRRQNTETVSTEEPLKSPDELSGISPEYASQVKQAFSAIETRQEELKIATSEHPELYKEFLDDLLVLDSSYRMLHAQASQTPNKDVIMKAMIQNLQLQAELLYRQLMISNEFKKQKTKRNEKVS